MSHPSTVIVVSSYLSFEQSIMSESSTEVDRLKKRRAGHRGVVSRLVNEANLLLDGDCSEKTVICLKMISAKLEEKSRLLKSFDESLLALIEVEEVEDNIMEAEVVSDKIDTVQSEIAAFVREPFGEGATEHVSRPDNSETLELLVAAKPTSSPKSNSTPRTEPVRPSSVEEHSHSTLVSCPDRFFLCFGWRKRVWCNSNSRFVLNPQILGIV